ncbi:FAD-dependent oxidoreductase [Caulobacter segnis]|uniref:FAD-dependent oxidoreductase n=1 Tax=Caulobacter segnis TaxID=88688 RepID=UPI00286604D6|nr:FAD-dependent oxidoreductase [Caulobacter segnis]MDR6625745.1 2-polyprenyl-6-methoxyphenol hydroxylase-like FAD-dependent oxidoreductase [Caulobacter segnis]
MPEPIRVQCCIVGGGPAGVMVGHLLARAGVEVLVVEKHGDFLRDFRGDTVHPSTLQAMADLGLLDDFLKLPHTEVSALSAEVGGAIVPLADFRHLPTAAKFIAFMPQWDFLSFLVERSRRFAGFKLLMDARATDIVSADGRIVGVLAETPDGPVEVRARLVIAADGRGSIVREQAGLEVRDLGAPMDVLWMRLSRKPQDPPDAPLGRISQGRMFISIPREGYYQCGYVAAKGGFAAIQAAGIDAFRREVASAGPAIADRVDELKSFDDVHLLTVKVDRLKRWWRPGLLCIGDAAHAMSPVGGVGINLAIQDAIAAANLLHDVFDKGDTALDRRVEAVQARREPAVKLAQALQVFVQRRLISRVLRAETVKPNLAFKAFGWFPVLRRLPARVIGMGFRMERMRSPEAGGA